MKDDVIAQANVRDAISILKQKKIREPRATQAKAWKATKSIVARY